MSTENLFSAPMVSAEAIRRMYDPKEASKILSIQTLEESEWLKGRYLELIKIMEEKDHD